MNVGFIGLGIMGRPMAGHLLKGGRSLSVFDLGKIPEDLTAGGAKACASGKEVAANSDVVITMVPDTPHVEAALFGAGGVAEGLSRGKIVVDMSSISPIATKDFARRIRELGCEYLDAPVSGGDVGAKAASLTIMVGGSQAAFDRVKPLFELVGKNITLVGANGDGQTTKVANHRGADDRGGWRGAAVCVKGGRRPCESARGAYGWFCQFAHPGSAWRAHGEAQFRSGLSYRIASEGPKFGAARCEAALNQPAEYRDVPRTVQCMRG
jgi:NAD binding domain of 6-phosphogluconate dehydrogenase